MNGFDLKLGYKRPVDGDDNYWFGKIPGGGDRKWIRVVAGVALPIQDRVRGAVVVIGEAYRSSSPQDFLALDAAEGMWPEIENALTKFRRDLKFGQIVVDHKEALIIVQHMRGIQYGLNEIPFTTDVTLDYALSEVGRAKTDQLISEGRLHLEGVKRVLDLEPEQGLHAVEAAVVWMDYWKPIYSPLRKPQRKVGQILGLTGL